ncbi:MAG: metallophosphoesterase, partial [Acidimicrobiia bacterium]
MAFCPQVSVLDFWSAVVRNDRHHLRPWIVPLLIAACLFGVHQQTTAAKDSPCGINGVSRVVAVGDVHGAYSNFVAVLKLAGLLDEKLRWSGGQTHLVQTGDVLDRGPDSRKAMDLLMQLEKEAREAGGAVHALLGNHEVFNLLGDLRYVSQEEYAAFQTNRSEELREQYYELVLEKRRELARKSGEKLDEKAFRQKFLAETPLGFVEHRQALGPTGKYGKWLRDRHAVVKIDEILYVHGGISPAVAPLGCEGINQGVRRELNEDFEKTLKNPLSTLAAREEGPLMYRGLAKEDEASFSKPLENILQPLGVRAMVVGHTSSKEGILTRFGGRVVMIDAGMLESYGGGKRAALEVTSEGMWAIYDSGRVKLETPAVP